MSEKIPPQRTTSAAAVFAEQAIVTVNLAALRGEPRAEVVVDTLGDGTATVYLTAREATGLAAGLLAAAAVITPGATTRLGLTP